MAQLSTFFTNLTALHINRRGRKEDWKTQTFPLRRSSDLIYGCVPPSLASKPCLYNARSRAAAASPRHKREEKPTLRLFFSRQFLPILRQPFVHAPNYVHGHTYINLFFSREAQTTTELHCRNGPKRNTKRKSIEACCQIARKSPFRISRETFFSGKEFSSFPIQTEFFFSISCR